MEQLPTKVPCREKEKINMKWLYFVIIAYRSISSH